MHLSGLLGCSRQRFLGIAVPRVFPTLGRRCSTGQGKEDEQIDVDVSDFKTHGIDSPSKAVKTSVGELLSLYETMQRMRRMEVAADIAYKAKLIRGFCHLYDGQEAVAAGMGAGSTPSDSIIQSYRNHCQYLQRGGSVYGVMAELMGKATGATHGVGGSMHLYNPKQGYWGGWGIVGSQVPLGAGVALRHKVQRDGGAAFVMYGDGAANQGQLYEAFNLAALWSLPAVFVCENNHYSMGTSESRASKGLELYKRVDYLPGILGHPCCKGLYGVVGGCWIATSQVNGMDVLAVKAACAYAKRYAVDQGPIVLEMDTYRYHGHSMSDPGSTYRTRDEIQHVRQARDPLELLRHYLTEAGYDVTQLTSIDKRVKQEVNQAIAKAKEAPSPPMDWLWRNVYMNPSNAELRDVHGSYHEPVHETDYSI